MRDLPPLRADGRSYALSALPPLRRVPVLRCEAPMDAPLPRYALRRHLRARLDAEHGRPVVVFTDAARSAEVWSRTVGPAGGPVRGRERVRRTGDPVGPAPWLDELLRPTAERLPHPPPPGHPAALLPRLLLRGAKLDAGEDPLQAAIELVARPGGPAAVGAVWRALLGLRVLDPTCGDGDWLLAALDVLAELYLACLEQMRVWIDEAALERRGRRSGLLRDFEAILARAGEAHGLARLEAFAREAAVLLNLHGAERDAAALRRCRRRFAARLRAGNLRRAGLPAAALNLRHGDPAAGLADRRALARALVGRADAAGRLAVLAEEAEVTGRADRLLRRLRLHEAMDGPSLAAGLRALEARRAVLSRELTALAGAGTPDDGVPPFHLIAEWNDVTRAGGFQLVRAGGP